MSGKHFNLVTEPWIKVIDDQNREREVSMEELFTNAAHYRQLAGEMKAQDLSILRFLLAILTTVYSRYNADDQPYDWLELDEQMRPVSFDEDAFDIERKHTKDELLNTWHKLYQAGRFSKVVMGYLHKYSKHFDLFDKEFPFYQVTREQYDLIVPKDKVVAKKTGIVAVKQINRTISESNNKPDIFSPKTPMHKEDISLSELTRWLITYQDYSGVSDKTKIEMTNFKAFRGWLYSINPVFAIGNDLFRTLMLNLILVPQQVKFDEDSIAQNPFWEISIKEYIQERKERVFPNNLAQLYTIWSRALYIKWEDNNPIIFSAKLPKPNDQNNFLEPMTTWSKNKDGELVPDFRKIDSLGKAMWRNFGQYVPIRSGNTDKQPGIVSWLNLLRNKKNVRQNFPICLMTAGFMYKDSKAQLPTAEFADEMRINADVLFDDNKLKKNYWPSRIENAIDTTNSVGNHISNFAQNVGILHVLGKNDKQINKNKDDKQARKNKKQTNKSKYSEILSKQVSSRFYEQLNQPFYEWLAGLTNEDDRDKKVNEWKKTVEKIALATAEELFASATSQDIRGRNIDDHSQNIFTYYRIFRASVAKTLDMGGKKNDGRD